jgi:hypothetical protein
VVVAPRRAGRTRLVAVSIAVHGIETQKIDGVIRDAGTSFDPAVAAVAATIAANIRVMSVHRGWILFSGEQLVCNDGQK